jgi:pimeloyl-ACP methyl ester carboxylesterase
MTTNPVLPRFDAVECKSRFGTYRMAWTEWGDQDNPEVLICVHGLSRSGRDFDRLAQVLCRRYRVVCPDIVGRGRSDWLPAAADPIEGYSVPQYVLDCAALLGKLGAAQVRWIGTSMGGLIGMALASLPQSPITRLVLNDVGPVLNGQALARIGEYIGADIRFASFDDGVQYVRQISVSFGPHTDDQWRKLAANVLVEREEDGRKVWRFHYDPRIGAAFRVLAQANPTGADILLWEVYDAIRCPTLVLRGAESDLLSRATHAAMGERGPKAQLVEFAGIGHAPMLMHEDQIAVVERFLTADATHTGE